MQLVISLQEALSPIRIRSQVATRRVIRQKNRPGDGTNEISFPKVVATAGHCPDKRVRRIGELQCDLSVSPQLVKVDFG
jgi:hypothetical protein